MLLRKYMSGWRRASRVGRREAVDKFWTDKMETMSTSIVAEYENKLAEMQHELNQAYGALEAERAQRNQLYEDLMNQFRRGVCAFNLEALGVLKPTDEADKVMVDMASGIQMGLPLGTPVPQSVPLQQQQRNAPRVVAHKKVRTGLPQGKVVVRSKATAGVEQENVRDSGKPLVQRNAPLRRPV